MIRPMTDADRPFVLDGWLKSYRDSRDIAFVEDEYYPTTYGPVIERALGRCRVLVDEGEVRRGFIAYEPEPYESRDGKQLVAYVWYVYVAQPFRRWRIARELFAAAGIDPESRFGYAARTRASWECRTKFPNAHHDSYRTRKSREQRSPSRKAPVEVTRVHRRQA